MFWPGRFLSKSSPFPTLLGYWSRLFCKLSRACLTCLPLCRETKKFVDYFDPVNFVFGFHVRGLHYDYVTEISTGVAPPKHHHQTSSRQNAAPCLKRRRWSYCDGFSFISLISFGALPSILSQILEYKLGFDIAIAFDRLNSCPANWSEEKAKKESKKSCKSYLGVTDFDQI